MSSTISATTMRCRPRAISRWATALAALAAVSTGCAASTTNGDGGSDGGAPDASAPDTTDAPQVTLSADGRLARESLLAPADMGGSWVIPDPPFEFPNSAELASTVPNCVEFAELVFEGGADHGDGIGTALINPDAQAIVFSYVVVFPTVDEATKMIEAVSTPAFDLCWNDFNVAAEKAILGAASDASYESKAPPELSIDADEYTVKSLEGFVVVGGTKTVDTCICAFAQVGRTVVEVHSPAEVFEPAERSRVVQLAIDKMRATLAAAD